MKDNNVGSPSIIFNRYHEKDKTVIRNAEMIRKNIEPRPCKKVVGYDANACISGQSCKICQRDSIHDDWKAMVLKSNGAVKW